MLLKTMLHLVIDQCSLAMQCTCKCCILSQCNDLWSNLLLLGNTAIGLLLSMKAWPPKTPSTSPFAPGGGHNAPLLGRGPSEAPPAATDISRTWGLQRSVEGQRWLLRWRACGRPPAAWWLPGSCTEPPAPPLHAASPLRLAGRWSRMCCLVRLHWLLPPSCSPMSTL